MKGRQAVILLRGIPLEGLDLFAQKIQVQSPHQTWAGRISLAAPAYGEEHELAMPRHAPPLWQKRDKVRFVAGVEAYPLAYKIKTTHYCVQGRL